MTIGIPSPRLQQILERAHGRWTPILESLGVPADILRRRNLPCPICKAGTDRFQYTDKFGEGNYYCRYCGSGGGFKLLQAIRGITFQQALEDVERCLGVLPRERPANAEPSVDHLQRLTRRIWQEASPIVEGDPVDTYLRARGLALPAYPESLRCHPALGYYAKDANGRSRKMAEHPAMLACVQATDDRIVTLHRTYLQAGKKLDVSDAKKLLSGGIDGAAVRLHEAALEIAVCEGLETGIAVHLATGKPVWVGLSATNLQKLCVPEAVRKVCIYADNDADGDFTGQCAAYALARQLRHDAAARQIRVLVPRQSGTDWADVWRTCQQRSST